MLQHVFFLRELDLIRFSDNGPLFTFVVNRAPQVLAEDLSQYVLNDSHLLPITADYFSVLLPSSLALIL